VLFKVFYFIFSKTIKLLTDFFYTAPKLVISDADLCRAARGEGG